VKIDRKIVLKINDINVTDTKNYEKQALNLHKTILAAVKTFNIFQKIEINNLNLLNYKIKKILLNNKLLTLHSELFNLKAVVNPNIQNSYINVISLTLEKYGIDIKNSVFNFYFNKNDISMDANINMNKNIFLLKGLLKNDRLKLNLYSKKIKNLKIENITIINADNLNTDIYTDLDTMKTELNSTLPSLILSVNKNKITANNIDARFKNFDLKLYAQNVYIPKIAQNKGVKNIYLKNVSTSYDTKNRFTYIKNGKILLNYRNFNIKALNTTLSFTDIKRLNLTNAQTVIKDKNNTVKINGVILNRINSNYYYTVNSTELLNKNFNITSSEVKGDLNRVFTKRLKGKVFNRNLYVKGVTVYLKDRKLKVNKIVYNNIPFYNIKADEKQITLHSYTLLDKNVKALLSQFLKLEVPITQIAGKNNIKTVIKLDKKDFLTTITSKHSLFKLLNFDLYTPILNTKIDKNRLTFDTKKSILHLTKDISLTYTGKGDIVYKNKNLVLDGVIDKFTIPNIINLNGFEEHIVVDFKKQNLQAKNAALMIDFIKKELIISPINRLLAFTPFSNYIKDGILLMKFSPLQIYTYLKLTLPILYKHNNSPIKNLNKYMDNLIENIYLSVAIGNDIVVKNRYLNLVIKKDRIKADLNGIDLNLFPLEKYIISDDGKKKENNGKMTKAVIINSSRSNFIYKDHKFLSEKAYLEYNNSRLKFKSSYKNASIEGYTKQQYLLMEGRHFDRQLFEAFLPSMSFFKEINTDFVLVKSPDDFYTGKIYINHAIVKELKTLNNIIAFINTIPSILSFSTPGFSAKGYKIDKGYINYLLYKKILYIKEAKIYGKNLDFFAKGYVDFNKSYIFLKVTANMKMKLKKIPIVGKGISYLLFGKDGSIDIKMVVKGDMANPEVKEDIGKDILLSPFKLFKRAITLPFNLF